MAKPATKGTPITKSGKTQLKGMKQNPDGTYIDPRKPRRTKAKKRD